MMQFESALFEWPLDDTSATTDAVAKHDVAAFGSTDSVTTTRNPNSEDDFRDLNVMNFCVETGELIGVVSSIFIVPCLMNR